MIVDWVPMNDYAAKYIVPPKPAKNYMPEWYKDLPPFQHGQTPKVNSGSEIDSCVYSGRGDATEKLCMPMFDTFTSGYIQESWCDINIRIDDDGNQLVVQADRVGPQIINFRSGKNKVVPKNSIWSDTHINWFTQWEPKTPKGWSTYYSHPFNQYDMPFRTIDGIIDTDMWWIGGSVPFLFKKGFEGTIPQGTPIYQMLFFKREKWQSRYKEFNETEHTTLYNKVFTSFHSGYKKFTWEKKSYD